MGKALAVAEKPSVGRDIAAAIGVEDTDSRKGYLENDKYIVTWAVGHLIGLKEPHEHDERYRSWALEDLPLSFEISRSLKVLDKDKTKQQFYCIKELIHRNDVDCIINCGDAGDEGELIQAWIYRMAKNSKPVKRLWISSFTPEAVREGFRNLKDNNLPEYNHLLVKAESRALADWILGMNYSRGLSLIYSQPGKTLSYGRCQTPLLNLLCKREVEIRSFVSVPYYNVEAEFIAEEGKYKGKLINDQGKYINIASRDDASNIVAHIGNEKGIIRNYRSAQKKKNAPLLFNLGALQQIAGTKYGYTAEETLTYAQKLYESRKILSYPRTDSPYLTTDLLNSIHNNLQQCCFGEFAPIVNKIKQNSWSVPKSYCNDAKVADHPALIPTDNKNMEAEYAKLSQEEKNIFDLVVKRFLAIFYPPYLYEATEIITEAKGYNFMTKGTVPLSMGYKEVYDDADDKEKDDKKEEKDDNQLLPKVSKGDTVDNNGLKILDKKTTCPKRYTAGTIIQLCEKWNIGTPATRGEIIKNLTKRGFITLTGGKYYATPVGEALVSLVPENLKAPNFTNEVQEQLTNIFEGKLSQEVFLDEILSGIRNNLEEFKKDKKENGSAVKDAFNKENMIADCPICNQGFISQKKTKEGKIFYGCSNYKGGCKFGFSETIFGRKFSKKEAGYLCNAIKSNKATPELKGFVSKAGKTFSAKLKYDREKNTFSLEFEDKKKKC